MANYAKPIENLPIFDTTLFTKGDEYITQNNADKRYLRYPNAQGTENLLATNINGALVVNSSAKLNSSVNIPNNDIFVRNIRIGYGSGNLDRNTILGVSSGGLITTGNDNVFLGSYAGNQNTTANSNVLIGSFTGRYITTGSQNTFVGRDAGTQTTTGIRNTSIGRQAGYFNTGNENVFIGSDADATGNISNSVAIGYNVKATASNTIVLGLSTQKTITPGGIDTYKPLLLNDTTLAANRSITSSFYNFYDSNTAGTLTQNGTLYNNAGAMYLQNTTNGGNINFVLNDAGGTQNTPLQLLSSGNTSNKPLTISANNNLIMPAGTGIINQSIVSGDLSTQNGLRRTAISMTSNAPSGSGTSALDVFDNTTSRGLFILPSAGGGSLGSTTIQGDCLIGSRVSNGGSLCLANWNDNLKNGIRIFTTDVNNCGLTLQCGQNSTTDWTELKMAYVRGTNTTTTTFNNVINFNPTTPSAIPSTRRKLEGLGTLSFTDNLNGSSSGSITSSIYTDSTIVSGLSGMYYDTNINSGSHIFKNNDSSGTETNSLALNSFVNTSYKRMYQQIQPTWTNVNGYYELSKDVSPTLNPVSSGVKSVSTWTTRTSAFDNDWYSICWSPKLGLFVAVANSGTSQVMTSSDGFTWTLRTTPTNTWRYVIWVPELGLFVATAIGDGIVTTNIMTSDNGTTWTARTTPTTNQLRGVAWSAELGLLVAVSDTGTANRVITSPDGITWTTRTTNDNNWQSVCWAPEIGLFVAVASTGTGNRVMTSPDGINWTTRTSGADIVWRAVIWVSELGLFIAVASSSVLAGSAIRIMTSPDGITWTMRTGASSNGWRALTWSSELKTIVAVSDSGSADRVMTSTNGINWTSRTTNDNIWLGVCWSPDLGMFVACSASGTGNRIMTSSLQGRNPTNFNVFNNTFNSISESGAWTIPTLNSSSIATSTLNSSSITTSTVAFDNVSAPTTTSQLGFVSTKDFAVVSSFSSQAGPNYIGNLTSLPAGSWNIIATVSFKGSGNHSLTTFKYGFSTSNAAFPTAMPYTLSVITEPNIVLNSSIALLRQVSINVQLSTATTIYLVEQLAWSGGGTVDGTVSFIYTRIG